MLTAVFLHGHLGEKYGEKLMLDIDCVAGAINLLKVNFRSFAKDLIGQGNEYRVWVGKSNIDKEELVNPAQGQDIHIVPVIEGAGGASMDKVGFFGPAKSDTMGFLTGAPHNFAASSEVGQVVRVIAGIVLVVVGLWFEIYPLVGMGVSMIFGGISDYITYSSIRKLTPMITERGGSTSKVSRYFNGPVNTVGQGNPVPILYGRMMVGSQVISGGFSDGDS